MLDVSLDVKDLVRGLELVDTRLGENIPEALELGAELVVAEARSNHDYTDRSNTLTDSIENDGVSGSWQSGDLYATVSAGAPHAAPIEFGSKPHKILPRHRTRLRWPTEGGFQFATEVKHPGTREYAPLGNALERKLPEITQVVEDAVDLSFAEAGFR